MEEEPPAKSTDGASALLNLTFQTTDAIQPEDHSSNTNTWLGERLRMNDLKDMSLFKEYDRSLEPALMLLYVLCKSYSHVKSSASFSDATSLPSLLEENIRYLSILFVTLRYGTPAKQLLTLSVMKELLSFIAPHHVTAASSATTSPSQSLLENELRIPLTSEQVPFAKGKDNEIIVLSALHREVAIT